MTNNHHTTHDREEKFEMNGNVSRNGVGSSGEATVLPIPVPPMLEEAMGYDGNGRLVAFYWGGGDEAYYADGYQSACGEWDAFLLFVEHPAVEPALAGYDLGSSEDEARHWLILDREERHLSVAPVATAQRLLKAQWKRPEPEPVLVVDEEAWARLVAEIEERCAQITPQQIMTAIATHQRLLKALRDWLDGLVQTPDKERE
jgi:hypothetical protein